MQENGKGRSTNHGQNGSLGWMASKNRSTHGREGTERPIPKPTTDLGFTGIRHKTSGKSVSQPSRRLEQ